MSVYFSGFLSSIFAQPVVPRPWAVPATVLNLSSGPVPAISHPVPRCSTFLQSWTCPRPILGQTYQYAACFAEEKTFHSKNVAALVLCVQYVISYLFILLLVPQIDKWSKIAKKRHNMDIQWSQDVEEFIIKSYDARFGVRSIQHEVGRQIVSRLAAAHEEDKIGEGDAVLLGIKDDEVCSSQPSFQGAPRFGRYLVDNEKYSLSSFALPCNRNRNSSSIK